MLLPSEKKSFLIDVSTLMKKGKNFAVVAAFLLAQSSTIEIGDSGKSITGKKLPNFYSQPIKS